LSLNKQTNFVASESCFAMVEPLIIPQVPFYFVRHGQSEANAAQIMCGGGVDTPLTALGRAQAQRAAEEALLLAPKPSVIISSTMVRARDTAAALAQQLKMHVHDTVHNLREHDVGDLEGHPYDAVPDIFGHEAIDPPNGETRAIFDARVGHAIANILHTHTHPMIVAHGGVAWAFARLNGIRPLNHAENACIYHFTPVAQTWRVSVIGREDVLPLF
jgi:2,3-bisphosphoglycerate-dependent phosphoglycerate mutase